MVTGRDPFLWEKQNIWSEFRVWNPEQLSAAKVICCHVFLQFNETFKVVFLILLDAL